MADPTVMNMAAPDLAKNFTDYVGVRLEEFKARHQNHVMNNALVNEMQREVAAMSYQLPNAGYYRSGMAQPIIIYPPGSAQASAQASSPAAPVPAAPAQAPAPAPVAVPAPAPAPARARGGLGGFLAAAAPIALAAGLGAGGVGLGTWIQAANTKAPIVNPAPVNIAPGDLLIDLIGKDGKVIPGRVQSVPPVK